MWTDIKDFFLDKDVFHARMRGLISLIGVLLASGTINLSLLSEQFGQIGWFIGYALLAIAPAIANGQKNLTPEELRKEIQKTLASQGYGAVKAENVADIINAQIDAGGK